MQGSGAALRCYIFPVSVIMQNKDGFGHRRSRVGDSIQLFSLDKSSLQKF